MPPFYSGDLPGIWSLVLSALPGWSHLVYVKHAESKYAEGSLGFVQPWWRMIRFYSSDWH